jgi:Uma2 family endonuclease
MSTASLRTFSPTPPALPLKDGERLTQAEFHRRYEACPPGFKAELIGGTVYVPSPLRRPHSTHHAEFNGALWVYKRATPGLELLDNATTILGEVSEPQPDLALRVLPEWGGRSRTNEDQYVTGPPELVVEIAHSTRSIALGRKRLDYEKAGVVEYAVLSVKLRELVWFHFPSQRKLKPGHRGVVRSRVFPGLWIDLPALLACDSERLTAALNEGLAGRGHAAFVKRLQAAHRRHRP